MVFGRSWRKFEFRQVETQQNSAQQSSRTMWRRRQLPSIYFVFVLVFERFVFECNCQVNPDSLADEKPWKCEKITVDFCKDIGYNVTRMPNLAKNDDQKHAQMELMSFMPLVKVGCSDQLKLFLCSVYTPYCTDKVNKVVFACRTLCEHVRDKCSPIMDKYGFPWPWQFNCSRFPPNNDDKTMCIEGKILPTRAIDKISPRIRTPPAVLTKPITKRPKPTKELKETNMIPSVKLKRQHVHMKSSRKYCRLIYAHNGGNYVYVDRIRSCALSCKKDGIFTSDEKKLADRWVAGLAYSCAAISLFAVLVVIFDYKSTHYPERAILFITICYLVYSISYIVRIALGREKVGCDEDLGESYVIQDGSGNIGCATTFLLSYCFSMAQSIWWVMLTLAWFLCAGMKWKQEAIRSCSVYFHIAAWGVPCGKTVMILMLRKIDVNELTGLCYVGNRFENLGALRGFVVGPLFTYLIMGTTFLIAGFVALFKIRAVSLCSSESETNSKLDQPLLPIGIFAALHTLFSTVILASYFYEYVNKESWYTNHGSSGPNFEVFLLRLVMYFGIGLLSGLLICFLHTPRTWTKLFKKFINNGTNENSQQLEPFRSTSETPV